MNRRSLAGLLALLLTACAPGLGTLPTPPAPPAPIPSATAPRLPTSQTPIAIGAPTGTPDPTSVPAPQPSPAPSLTAQPTPADEIAVLDASPRPERDPIALARALGSCRADPAACPSVARTMPLDVQVGERRDFYVADFDADSNFTVSAELRYAGPVVLMYVEPGLSYSQTELERTAQTFEQTIYPRSRAVFGSELQPGVDGDNRITILTTRGINGGVLGYFSTQDSLPAQVNRYSNEREMFVMSGGALPFGQPGYLSVLAHEFQHMLHDNQRRGAELWLNEGMSELSADLNGFGDDVGFPPFYLANPDLQLNTWGGEPGVQQAHYGAAHLFVRYIYAQYGGETQLLPLIRADAGEQVQAFVDLAAQKRPDITSFGQIVADWAVANLIDDTGVADGRYGYATGHSLPNLLPGRVAPVEARGTLSDTVAQFGADYLALPVGASFRFSGASSVGLASEPPQGRYAWWSGRSDDSLATLTRPLDLRGLSAASLEFEAWYEIENDYDYAFVSVSSDGGATWETLPGSLTTDADPQGINYGNGITGVSGAPGEKVGEGGRGRWVSERMDLTPYAGRELLLRFWSINDAGFNAPGLLLDNIRVPELGLSDDVEAGAGEWAAAGFVRVDGDLPQRWELRLVRSAADGTVRVETLPTDAAGAAAASLAPDERGVLIVVAATPHTSERAAYQVTSDE